MQYKSTVAGLVGRAKAIIQVKPRNPDCILKTSIPIKAICDYRQIEVRNLNFFKSITDVRIQLKFH